MFNHVSYVDAIAMTHFFALSGVAKASVAGIPFVGAIAVALQFLFVQRRGSADARNKHTQLAGKTVEKIATRAADSRWASARSSSVAHPCCRTGCVTLALTEALALFLQSSRCCVLSVIDIDTEPYRQLTLQRWSMPTGSRCS